MTVSESGLSSSPAQHHFAEMISTYDQYGGRYMVTNNISEIRKEKHLSQDAPCGRTRRVPQEHL